MVLNWTVARPDIAAAGASKLRGIDLCFAMATFVRHVSGEHAQPRQFHGSTLTLSNLRSNRERFAYLFIGRRSSSCCPTVVFRHGQMGRSSSQRHILCPNMWWQVSTQHFCGCTSRLSAFSTGEETRRSCAELKSLANLAIGNFIDLSF